MITASAIIASEDRPFPLDVSKAPDMLSAALIYAMSGFPVFPVSPGIGCGMPAKAPLTPHGLKNGTRDLKQVERFWSRFPEACVGLCLGEPSGLFVVDLDCHGGNTANGFDTLARLRDRGFELPQASLIVETPSGGEHHYYALPPDGIRNRKLPGIDLLGTGKYVLAVPSRLADGRSYRIKEVRQ